MSAPREVHLELSAVLECDSVALLVNASCGRHVRCEHLGDLAFAQQLLVIGRDCQCNVPVRQAEVDCHLGHIPVAHADLEARIDQCPDGPFTDEIMV